MNSPHTDKCRTTKGFFRFWLGGARCNGKLHWLFGGSSSSFQPNQKKCIEGTEEIESSNWLPGEPSNDDGIEHCVEIITLKGKTMLNDTRCKKDREGACSLCYKSAERQ